jgi:hypothetical protein
VGYKKEVAESLPEEELLFRTRLSAVIGPWSRELTRDKNAAKISCVTVNHFIASNEK